MESIETRIDALEKRVKSLECGGKPKKTREPRQPSAYQIFLKKRYSELKDDDIFSKYEGKSKFVAVSKACAEEWKIQQNKVK
tara:strand:+ start:16438 stop:16683 length:246 start_codon:yes stop_codon:yes gene_type:complete